MPRALVATLLVLGTTFAVSACGDSGSGSSGDTQVSPVAANGDKVLDGSLPLLTGEEQDLSEFEGDVVLVVNTASECGYTPQFESLQALYEEHEKDGFTVLGFPADDVAGQEPRDGEELKEFCEANYGVEFPMFAKSDVLGETANPLFQKLTAAAGAPTWNFNKYLLDRKGQVVEHYEQGTAPDDPALTAAIEDLL